MMEGEVGKGARLYISQQEAKLLSLRFASRP